MKMFFPKMTGDLAMKAGVQASLGTFFVAACLLFFPGISHAATLTLDPAESSFGPGDMFVVSIRLDTDTEECINAATIVLDYPIQWLKATAFSKGESLLTLWPDEPVIDTEHGTVTFSGGIPAGYCGRVQGDPGKTNILGKIAFSVSPNPVTGNAPTGPISLALAFGSSTKVLANDGFGTETTLMKKGATVTRVLTSQGKTNEWIDIVNQDKIPPDAFKIEVAHDSNTFGGKFFIVFSTVDKQSGVEHYEATEDDPARLGLVYGKNEKAIWKSVVSPYVLTDQTLQSRVIVRAIDNAGNVEEAILAPTNGDLSIPKETTNTSAGGTLGAWCVIAALIGVLMGGILLFIRRRKEGGGSPEVMSEEPHDTQPPN